MATNRPGWVAVRNSTTGKTVEFTTDEWTAFLTGARVGEFDFKAWELRYGSVPAVQRRR